MLSFFNSTRFSVLLLTAAVVCLLIGCSSKANFASIEKKFDGKNCVLIAESARAVSWRGIGGSCMVLPVLFPNSSYMFRISISAESKDTLVLEYSSFPSLMSEKDLKELLDHMELSYSPSGKQVWYKHKAIDLSDTLVNRMVHQLNDSSVFYSNESYTKAPDWHTIKSPEFYYEKLLADSGIDRACSITVWDITSKVSATEANIRLAFSQWFLDAGGRRYLTLKASEVRLTQVWQDEMNKLTHRICDPIIIKPALNTEDEQQIRSLFETLEYYNPQKGTQYDENALKIFLPVCEKFFFNNDVCAELIDDLASYETKLPGLFFRLYSRVQAESNHEKQLAYALRLNSNSVHKKVEGKHYFLNIWLRHYAHDDSAYQLLAEMLRGEQFDQEEMKDIKNTLQQKKDKRSDSLSNELLMILQPEQT